MFRKALEHKTVALAILAIIGLLAASLWAMPVPLAAQEPPTVAGGVENQGDAPPQSVPASGEGTAIVRDTFINFDDLVAQCLFNQTASRLTTRYAAQGVTFAGPGGNDGGAILDACSQFGVTGFSAPNFLAFNVNSTGGFAMLDGGVPQGPETLTFSSPVDAVDIIAGAGCCGGSGTITMQAFNASNGLVDTTSLGGVAALQTMTVAGPGIVKVVISFTGSVLVVDNLGFDLDAGLTLTGPTPGTVGVNNTLTASGATPGATVHFAFGTTAGSTAVPGCAGESVDFAPAKIAGTALADASGVATLSQVVPATASGKTFLLQAVEQSTCRVSNLVTHTFP